MVKATGLHPGSVSALPRIPHQQASMSISNFTSTVYDTYPGRLPATAVIPKKVNPLQPTPPKRRTVALETIDPHWQNEQRTMRMKQREHHRYHDAWSKYYYGSQPEQEQYRAYTRSVLKQQMRDLWSRKRQDRTDRSKESQAALLHDRQDRMQDMNNAMQKVVYLKTFRDENKKLMENSWQNIRDTKTSSDRFDREQMLYNPINWSHSLH
ncbi:hypothetical protein CAPTEDRAFT_228779 [Capitella teleta]|uniref:Uncharacterized protein n=1 Tax=Capitella teleta TaxID=283909 RepID=R7VIY8_CAPTE|nr:hypothetical protein CAPTEDRAFT_228779 [Capitella teleta]|eukprot:ELU18599.1 hypothetical protein CAPTEDRAFT_228779 [Capitella teleta]